MADVRDDLATCGASTTDEAPAIVLTDEQCERVAALLLLAKNDHHEPE